MKFYKNTKADDEILLSKILPRIKTKQDLLNNSIKYPILHVKSTRHIKKFGSTFFVDGIRVELKDMKVGDLIQLLQTKFEIEIYILVDKVLCELPSTLITDFDTHIVSKVEIDSSPFLLNYVSKENSTILVKEKDTNYSLINSSGIFQDYNIVSEYLYSAIKADSNNTLYIKDSANDYYIYFDKNLKITFDSHILNFGIIA